LAATNEVRRKIIVKAGESIAKLVGAKRAAHDVRDVLRTAPQDCRPMTMNTFRNVCHGSFVPIAIRRPDAGIEAGTARAISRGRKSAMIKFSSTGKIKSGALTFWGTRDGVAWIQAAVGGRGLSGAG
jgi:hypothetical protein